jgi:putative membrane protein insertion efficiency factor
VASLVRLPASLAVALIRLYQKTLGRLTGGRCRFHPSCSEYAAQSISAKGVVRGGALAFWRLARCGPWTAGGIDPARVPGLEEAARG